MPRGRPITVNVKEDKSYFAKYYHLTNEDHICECGSHYKLHSKRRHLLSKKHTTLMNYKHSMEGTD